MSRLERGGMLGRAGVGKREDDGAEGVEFGQNSGL